MVFLYIDYKKNYFNMEIEKFSRFKESELIKEEFIIKAIKGALSKLANFFAAPFKDLAKDFKDMFKEDEPNSLVNVIMTNFNQAIDASQKEINNIQDETAIIGIMDNFCTNLIDLANNIGKDIETALGKGKSKAVVELSKAIILGNKQIDFVGIVGLLDPMKGLTKKDVKYKFSKQFYITELNKGKDLKSKKAIAMKFLDNFQVDLKKRIAVDVTPEEMEELYKTLKEQTGVKEEGKIILDWGDVEIELKAVEGEKGLYKVLKSGSKVLVVEEGKDLTAKISGTAKKGQRVKLTELSKGGTPLNIKGKPEYETGALGRIVVNDKEVEEHVFSEGDTGEGVKKAQEALGKIKNDSDKLGKVAKFAEFIQDEKNKDKVEEIIKQMSGEGGE
jgi:hypothetical protein